MERNPWWQNVAGDSGVWKGPVGVKPDGGGSIRGQGRVGDMKIHRAVHNKRLHGKITPNAVLMMPAQRCASLISGRACCAQLAGITSRPKLQHWQLHLLRLQRCCAWWMLAAM